ncbi:hypothetical protein GCM10009092_17710 [Bowmanella denitrificans]|uniref:Uncharacterized protein n=1 Tax=Bowmanella denitrificans TaxID=366582 RepID=A0ABN0X343_9ALTE
MRRQLETPNFMKLEISMFKKSLIAASMALATVSTAALAASSLTVTGSTEGVIYSKAVGQVDVPTVTFTTGREYSASNVITLTVTGADVATTNSSNAAIVPTVVVANNTAASPGALQFLSYEGNVVKFLVNGGDLSTGTTVTVSGLKVNASGAADKGTVKVSGGGIVVAAGTPVNVDATKAETAITFAAELATKVDTKFDAIVDVNAARKDFTGAGADSKRADTLVISNTLAATANPLTTSAVSYTVYGDFGFLDQDGNGKLGDAKDGNVTSAAGTVTFAADMMSVSIASAAAYATGTVGVTVNTPAGVVIPDQAFKVSQAVTYTNPAGANNLTAATLTMADAGAWTLNGAKVHVPVMYYGPSYAQAVTISNTSTQAGSVDVVFYIGEDTYEVEGIAMAVAEGVTNVSAAIRDAAAAAGVTSGAVSFDVIVNAPNDAVSVDAIYYARHDGDRVKVK